MGDTRSRQPFVSNLYHLIPSEPASSLAAPPEHAQPTLYNPISEPRECANVSRHRMVIEVASDDVPQPFPECRYGLVHMPTQFLLNHPKLRQHSIPPGFPLDQEFAVPGFAADESEAQEVEGLRFTEPAVFCGSSPQIGQTR